MTLDVKKAREIIAAATPGPWGLHVWHYSEDLFRASGPTVGGIDQAERDAAFIAAARTGWPEALDEIERLQGLREGLMKDAIDSPAIRDLREKRNALAAENAKLRAVAEAAQVLLLGDQMDAKLWGRLHVALASLKETK